MPIRFATLYFRDLRDAASLRYRNRTEITVLVCEQSPVQYGFSACAKAIRDSVNMALFTHLSQTLWNDIIYFRQQYKRYTVT